MRLRSMRFIETSRPRFSHGFEIVHLPLRPRTEIVPIRTKASKMRVRFIRTRNQPAKPLPWIAKPNPPRPHSQDGAEASF